MQGMLYSNKINKCKHQRPHQKRGIEKAERPQSTYWSIWFLKNCDYKFLLYSKIGKLVEFVDCESAYFERIGPSVSVGSGDICGGLWVPPSGRREMAVVSSARGRKTSWHAWLSCLRNDCCLEKLKANPGEVFWEPLSKHVLIVLSSVIAAESWH